jgi:general secretion pathway protein I
MNRSSIRVGLSLLEVILALSILGIATGILSSIMHQAADNGLKARRITQAQMVCEAKMAEAISGAIPLQPTQWTPTTSADGSAWYFALDLVAAEIPNMVGIGINVTDEIGMNESARPLSRLVQWIIDPNLGLDTKPATDPNATSTTAAGGSSSGSTGAAK